MGLVMGRKRLNDGSNPAVTSIPVASTGNKYTTAIDISRGTNFSLKLKATSSGTIDVLVKLEQSHVVPDTEGASDVKYVTPEGVSNIINLTDGNWREVALSPIAAKFMRLLLDGQGSNHASTVVEGYLTMQEETNR